MTKSSLTTKLFIERAIIVHGSFYNYSKSKYKKRSDKLDIICPRHGLFSQTPGSHLRGSGCPKCAKIQAQSGNNRRRLSQDQFLERARKMHGNNYLYDFVNYVNYHSKIMIYCSRHGKFLQTPANHCSGQGCPKCAELARNESLSLGQQEFLSRARVVHGEKYDYSVTKFSTKAEIVSIICPKHGQYQQSAGSHLNGRGCQQCGVSSLKNKLRLPFDKVIERAKSVHGEKYGYNKASYDGTKPKMVIKCDVHGLFRQSPGAHFLGGGCPRCSSSAFQQSVCDYLASLGVGFVVNDREMLDNLELDIYIKEKNLAIECDGVYWHSFNKKETKQERNKHVMKQDACASKGIDLFNITDEEWKCKRVLLESMLKYRCGLVEQKIYARDCDLVRLPKARYREFTHECHLFDYRSASIVYALMHGEDVVSIMSFAKHRKYNYEIIRYCCALNTVVVGGGSRLFAKFVNDIQPQTIFSYADRRISNGQLYLKLGMSAVGITGPNYRYVKNGVTFSRQQFQKHKLVGKLDHFDSDLTEWENMFLNGFRRIWDAGHFRFLWTA